MANTYISSVEDRGAGHQADVGGGRHNIGNVMPPVAARAFSNQNINADIATYSPIGRLVHGDLAVSF